MAVVGNLEVAEEEVGIVRVLAGLVADADRRRATRGIAVGPARFTLSELRARLLKERVFEDPGRLLLKLRRRGLLEEGPEGRSDRGYRVPEAETLRELLIGQLTRAEISESAPFSPVPDEASEIRGMDGEFVGALREILAHRLEATIEFGRRFSVRTLRKYVEELFGEALALDSLIALLQQYALVDVPLLAPTGRPTGSTGFHLALFGPPGTGK
ncbi:MAG: hypothetical protein ACYDFT_06955, partial [Thermoplasmata archaeon]